MPPKIRDLITMLEAAGFVNRGGKGSHRNYQKQGHTSVVISGKAGDDARPYQVRDVKRVTGELP